MYEYRATVDRVIDGDSYAMTVDLGWHVSVAGSVRLIGVNCPESGADGADEATAYVTEAFAQARQVTVTTVRRDPSRSFARYLARVDVDGADLADLIIAAGHGEPYPAARAVDVDPHIRETI